MTSSADLWDGACAHAALERVRQETPVHEVTLPNGMSVRLITHYADVRAVLSDSRFVTAFTSSAHTGKVDPGLLAGMNSHMMAANGVVHARLRRLVSAAFTRRRIEGLEPRIREIADELFDAMADRDQVDLIADYAAPLPARVIAGLIGVPEEDRHRFVEWSRAYLSTLGTATFPEAEMTEFVGYLRELIAYKRAQPDDSLLCALISARDDGQRLSDDELTSSVFLLIVAGNDTTANLIGNGMYLLLAEPERLAGLASETVPALVEEILRYESPLYISPLKVAAEPVEIGGTVVPGGEPVMLSLLSANRDEAEFPEAARFCPDRGDSRHLAFGLGEHYCLGAPLARLEGRVAIEALVGRYPGLRLAVAAEAVRWRPGMFVHGLLELPVSLR